jgi:hypothetical protein
LNVFSRMVEVSQKHVGDNGLCSNVQNWALAEFDQWGIVGI